MLDFIISMAVPESICLFAAKEDAEMQRMLKKLKFMETPLEAKDVPWKKRSFYRKHLKRRAA